MIAETKNNTPVTVNIIPHGANVVNVFVEKFTNSARTAERRRRSAEKSAERAADAKRNPYELWQIHKSMSQRMALRMAEIGLKSRGERMFLCGNELTFAQCADCGTVSIKSAHLCRDRLCPTCSWRLSIKRYAAMRQIMDILSARRPELTYTLVTLTAENCTGNALSQRLEALQKCWHYAMSQRWTRAEIVGWARSIECTYSDYMGGTMHPHYHVIVAAPHAGAAQKLVTEWLQQAAKHGIRAVADAQHVDAIQSPDVPGKSLAGAVCEVYKYAVKSDDLLGMPLSALRDLADGLSGKRLISFGGLIKAIAIEIKSDNLDNPDDDNDITLCKHCGSQRLDEISLKWALESNKYIASVRRQADAEKDIQRIIDKAIEVREAE